MTLDAKLISLALKKPDLLLSFQQAGVTDEWFIGDYEKVWRYILRMHNDHGSVPSPDLVAARFKFFDLEGSKKRDAPMLLHEIQRRHKWQMFLAALDQASMDADDVDTLDIAIGNLQSEMNSLAFAGEGRGLVDAFGAEARKRMIADLEERRRGGTIGIPTGLKRFDYVTNGLQHSRMVVIMARPGIGKSWLNLLFCASAVMSGKKVVLFPLEMTFEETALRLYTIFSQRMGGSKKVLRNLDLSSGRISPKKVVKFLHALEDKFAGSLMVADIGNMADPYTIDRVGADVAIHQPDMFWIDYITLMKFHGARDTREDILIKGLSNGIKQTAVRNRCVGGASAQVNREAIKTRDFLPRVENIAYGDAIGQDADQVISINRKDAYLYYALVKNRLGPEIGKTRTQFMVDEGIIADSEDQDDEDED